MSADLTPYLDETERGLVVEGLARLRAIKQGAFEAMTLSGIPGSERFRPTDFAIPQIDALLIRFGEHPVLAASDLPSGPRIIGTFFKEAWGGASGNEAIEIGRESFDATRHVLAMDLDEIHQLKDCRESTDEIGKAHVRHDGPHQVVIIGAICHFFDTDSLSSITEDMLLIKREAYGVEAAQAMSP